jgi:hypothetical protein
MIRKIIQKMFINSERGFSSLENRRRGIKNDETNQIIFQDTKRGKLQY